MSDDRSVYLSATTGLMLGAIVITISIAAQFQWFWTDLTDILDQRDRDYCIAVL